MLEDVGAMVGDEIRVGQEPIRTEKPSALGRNDPAALV
jgi:hypothetical protein